MSTHATTTTTTPLGRSLRRGATTLAGGALLATGLFAASGIAGAPSAEAASGWDQVANCESGGNWSTSTGNGYHGGLQFSKSSWAAAGGTKYASSPEQASRGEQIAVAENLLAKQGKGAWPNCGKYLNGGANTSSKPSGGSSNDSSKRKETRKKSTGSSHKAEGRQGDWSCNGDGIPNNCTENGFTKKSAVKKSEKKQASQKSSTPVKSSKKASVGSPDLKVAGTVDVDGTMGPDTIKALQDWLGVEQTGKLDKETVTALQAWTKTEQDGKVGAKTMAGLQREIGAQKNGAQNLDDEASVRVLQQFLNLY